MINNIRIHAIIEWQFPPLWHRNIAVDGAPSDTHFDMFTGIHGYFITSVHQSAETLLTAAAQPTLQSS